MSNLANVLPLFASILGIDPVAIHFLRSSQNHVFEFTDTKGHAKILRITEDSHRARHEIADELDWISYLKDSGANVCVPIEFSGGLIFSASHGKETFHGVVFEKAKGRPLQRSDLTADLYRLHGKSLGLMHRLAKNDLQERLGSRKRWHEERYFTSDLRTYLPEQVQTSLLNVFSKLQSSLNSAEKSKQTFGPVHLDLGYSNFFLDEERLEIFDFDNCTHGYFVSDIAAALYSSVFIGLRREFPGDRSPFENPKSGQILEQVWEPFCEGYTSENGWINRWNEDLEQWFKVLYFRAVIHAYRMQSPVIDPKVQTLLDVDIQNILSGTVPVRFDFRSGQAIL